MSTLAASLKALFESHHITQAEAFAALKALIRREGCELAVVVMKKRTREKDQFVYHAVFGRTWCTDPWPKLYFDEKPRRFYLAWPKHTLSQPEDMAQALTAIAPIEVGNE